MLLYIVSNQKKLSIVSFSLFSAWLLSVPFQGQILFTLISNLGVNEAISITLTVLASFLGLFSCGFFVKKQISAKMTMITSSIVCITGSLIFFLPFSMLWYLAIPTISFFSGLFVASWGFFFKAYSEPQERFRTAADVIIFSNVLMIALHVLTVVTSAYIALGASIILVLGSLLLILRLDAKPPIEKAARSIKSTKHDSISPSILKALVFLLVFIVVITINSGLMYSVVTPAFEHFAPFTNYYWAIPYILALVILRNLPTRLNQAYILYIALAMIGLAFISFMSFDRSFTSYLIIDTLMLGAFGIFDLFWWSILGSFLNYSNRPAQIFGIGLSMNVMGIFLGGIIANQFVAYENSQLTVSTVALIVIFIVLIMLPLLNTQLTRIFKNHVFLVQIHTGADGEQQQAIDDLKDDKRLTEKEKEVVELLLRGYTYKAIAEKLYISENTMKFHVKNVYQKLQVNNKMELVNLFSNNEI